MAIRKDTDAQAQGRASHAARALGDAALLAAMRRGEEAAFREFIVRFEVQLDQHARRLGLVGGERRAAVTDTLDDAAMALISPGRATPRSLPAYLVTSLRNRLRNERRSGARVRLRDARAGHESPVGDDASLCCSEGSLRASAGPVWEPPAPSPAVAALSAALVRELTDEERVLLVWVSHHVPYREIAAWLGVGYAAVGKRVERLRARLRAHAEMHLATLGASERDALQTLLARGAVPGRLDQLPIALARPAVRPDHLEKELNNDRPPAA